MGAIELFRDSFYEGQRLLVRRLRFLERVDVRSLTVDLLSIDAGTGYTSRTATISYDRKGKPIPAENNPRRVFESLFDRFARSHFFTRNVYTDA